MTRLYVAGSMRGIPDFNFPAFDAAAEQLRQAGYEVFNPADHDRALGVDISAIDIRDSMAADTDWICRHADGVALLPGWGESLGARAEVALAQAIGIPFNSVAWWVNGGRHYVEAVA